MKRILFLLIFLLSFSLCCCSLLSGLLGTSSNEKVIETDVPVNTKGEVYLVKLNMSQKIIKGENTGYVSGVSSRAAADCPEYSHTDAFVRDLNRQVNDFLINQASSRAAEFTIGNDYKILNDKKGDENYFYVLGADEKFQKVRCVCKYVTEHCIIYADEANSNLFGIENYIDDSAYKYIGDSFEKCYEKEINIIGSPIYKSYLSDYCVPCTSKITFIVSDLFRDGKQKENSGTVGYNYSGDFFKKELMQNSNEREVIYLDAAFLAEDPNYIYTTSIHEFNHLINFVIKTVNIMTENKTLPNRTQTCDTWFTEMLSMTTEDMFQSYLGIEEKYSPKARLPYFGMAYYCGFKNWENKNVDQLISYANTYAFGAFLARNFGGIDLIKEIAQNDYVNEQAITKALQKVNPNYKDLYTGKIVELDIDYAVRRFSACVVFTEEGDDYTLNKGTAFTKEGLGFDKLDISTKIDYEGTVYNVPLTFKKEAKLDIYPTGFTVHYVGYNISGFKLAASNNEYLEYYLVTK